VVVVVSIAGGGAVVVGSIGVEVGDGVVVVVFVFSIGGVVVSIGVEVGEHVVVNGNGSRLFAILAQEYNLKRSNCLLSSTPACSQSSELQESTRRPASRILSLKACLRAFKNGNRVAAELQIHFYKLWATVIGIVVLQKQWMMARANPLRHRDGAA
jgi:hypothetical protein